MPHILQLVAENFKRLRVVEITPKGRVVQITGKNGQGKTSVLDSIWSALQGAKAIPEKPVRKGAEKARIRVDLGELVITRTISGNGTHTLTVENAKGTKLSSPQAVLDELLGVLTFDPLEFIAMKPKEQVELLRRVAQIDLDVDALNAANRQDYDARTEINRDITRLETEIASIPVQSGLPKDKIDDSAILGHIKEADAKNLAARQADETKRHAMNIVTQLAEVDVHTERSINKQRERAAALRQELQTVEENLVTLETALTRGKIETDKAREYAASLPDGAYVVVTELTQQLQDAQVTNREIDKRSRREQLQANLHSKRNQAAGLTRAMEGREEQKRGAVANAQMPVAGLMFSEDNQVIFNGIPIAQMGEAEQIQVSTAIAMAANPKLRILRIMHGEALDDDSLAMIAALAEKHDYQVWMARVDSSGKVGVFLEDGMVKADAQEEGPIS